MFRKDIDVFRVSTNKRKPYQYENEYSALILHQFIPAKNKQKIPKFEIGASVKLDLAKLIDRIYVSPFTNDWFYKMVESVLNVHFHELPKDHIRKSDNEDK